MMLRFFACILALSLSACEPRLEGEAEIHYVALAPDLEILLPITPDTITEMNNSYGKVEVSDPRFQELMVLLDGAGPGSFYKGTTRVRIRDSQGTTIYIDSAGGVRRNVQESALDYAALERMAALLESMTSSRPYSALPTWAEEAAHSYVAKTQGWPRTDYSLSPGAPRPQAQDWLVIVKVAKVSYRDLVTPSVSAYRRVIAAHGQSFELHFDRRTEELVRQISDY
jgi:hypothetical protein